MTHSPPVPEGNQSPYPLQEPPHAKPGLPPVVHDEGGGLVGLPTSALIGAAIVAGLGAAAAAGAYLLSLRKPPAPKRRRRQPKA